MSAAAEVEHDLTNEELAAQLMQCAILVKKGEKGPLLLKTLHDLNDYLGGRRPRSRPTASASAATAAAAAPPAPSSSPTSEAISKPTKPPHFGAVLGKMMGMTGEPTHEPPQRSMESKAATSSKNAARAKSDLEDLARDFGKPQSGGSWFSHHEEPEWCEKHFCMGCACKKHAGANDSKAPPSNASAATSVQSTRTAAVKPAFSRPTNPKSALIANGWIEQQRRSKMRTVWKEVLASLVEGRRPGEETTLWIQREVTSALTGKTELEALHQIPIKWIQDIVFLDYSTDNRFTLKVYNLPDEFIFRCADNHEAAQNWVLTLRSIQQIAQAKPKVATAVNGWEKSAAGPSRSFDEEKKLPDKQQQQHETRHEGHRMTITELRAIAHGHGIPTVGMERGELEAVVAQIAAGVKVSTNGPPSTAHAPTPGRTVTPDAEDERRRREQAEMERRRQEEVEMKRRHAEEIERRRRAEEAARQHAEEKRRAEEAERRRVEDARAAKLTEEKRRVEEARLVEERRLAEEEEKKRKEQEEVQRRVAERVREQQRLKEEEERRRLAEERMRRDEEEIRRRVAEQQAAEQRRKQEEAQRLQQQQWAQQQQEWQKQQAEAEQRRRAAEMQAAEARRQQEEAFRRQQQWQQQQQQQRGQQAMPQWQQQQAPNSGGAPIPQQTYAQPPPEQPRPPPPTHGHAPPPPNTQTSPINSKYAKMAQQSDDGTVAITHIKHGILIQWALLPPMMQILRPIGDLLTSIHTVFPPKFGVPGHDYFKKWSPISYNEISQGPALGNRPDDAKLKKVMRKLRFFLHPDKLPRDLSSEQQFMCKMLWDIISDAEAEHKKREEDLGWIRG